MPAVGKEIERQIAPEQIAQPVEAVPYVEKVEKQTETQQMANTPPQQVASPPQQPLGDMGKIVAGQFAVQTKPKIILPVNQASMEDGLRHGVREGVRWLSEWCVMMIKKYPGRVFYLPPEN